MKEEIVQMLKEIKEFPQYDTITYTKDFVCPDCGGSGDGYHHVPGDGYVRLPDATFIGWCSTTHGYMMVFECSKCFTKFRYHNSTTARNNWDDFVKEMWLVWHLQKHKNK